MTGILGGTDTGAVIESDNADAGAGADAGAVPTDERSVDTDAETLPWKAGPGRAFR